MTGEALALLAALAYGLAGVLIVRARPSARGDNGVFLSIMITALLSWGIWMGWGTVAPGALWLPGGLGAIAVFALAGILSNGVGRLTMYRATERIGAVRAGLLRRLTPLFALPCAFLILGEVPDLPMLLGAALVLAGVLVYLHAPGGLAGLADPGRGAGLALGVVSALAYALAYSLRGFGLGIAPDAALGTCIGALAGAVCVLVLATARRGWRRGWRFLTLDRSPRHMQAALSLSAGQVLQFFALKTAPVVTVAVLGTLEVFFSALIVLVVTKSEVIAIRRLLLASLMAMAGTALIFR